MKLLNPYRRWRLKKADPHKEWFTKPYNLARFLIILFEGYGHIYDSKIYPGFRFWNTTQSEFSPNFPTVYWPKKLEIKARKILKPLDYE